MRPWWGEDREKPQPAEVGDGHDADAHAKTAAAVRAAGIDLDPPLPGRAPDTRDAARDADADPTPGADPAGHAHPHLRSAAGQPPVIGIVGGGAVGTALAMGLTRAGWPVRAVASRDPARRERFGRLVPGARAFAEASALVEEVELIILAVPDDAIAPLAAGLRMYGGQAMVHTSGALGAEVLTPAMAAGTQIGAFHPLVAFADTERAVASLHGATIAIEGDEELASLLADMALALGAQPVRLAPGSKAAYHAAAVLAAGGFVALLDAIAELGRVAGLDEPGALAIYGPLVEQTLANARALGIRQALTGPITRGDRGTLDAHLAALRAHAPGVLDLYRAAASREIELALARGALAPEAAEGLRSSLASDP